MTSVSTRSTTATTASKRTGVLEDMNNFVIKEGRKLRESGAHLEDMRNLKLKPIYEVAGTLDDIEIKVKVKS